jgi:hypothetical protein
MEQGKTCGDGLTLKIAFVVLAAGVYGAVLAAWRSPLMAAYVAAKLPVVFVGTTFMVSAFCWMAGLIAGAELRYREVLGAVFSAMSVTGAILLALAPVALFFILSGAPDSGSCDELRFTHASLMLMHLVVLGGAGVLGNVVLVKSLRRRVPASCRLPFMLVAWLLAFALVGCQFGWMLRPMVGSPNIAVEFLREDALDSNFLESLFRQIIPHFMNKGAIR